jgi:hypothetical protein
MGNILEKKHHLVSAILFTIISLQFGCAIDPKAHSLIEKSLVLDHIKSRIDNISLPVHLPTQGSIPKIDIPRFNSCMAPLSSKLKLGFIDLLHRANDSKDDLDFQLLGKINELDDDNLLTNHPVIEHIFDKLLTAATIDKIPTDIAEKAKADLTVINNQLLDQFRQNRDVLKKDTKQAAERTKHYLASYFKKGIAQVVQDEKEKAELHNKAAALLNLKVTDPALVKVFAMIDPQLTKTTNKPGQKSLGFIGRDGSQYGFPGIVEQNTQVSIDHNQIGADGIRIVLEALRDTYAPLPVLENATAAATLPDYVIKFDEQGKGSIQWRYDHHDPAKFETIKVDNEHFQTIEAYARKAEATIAGTVGKAIRGGSLGALNNEAVAKIVETAAGVIARHVTERAAWCVQAQLDATKIDSHQISLE